MKQSGLFKHAKLCELAPGDLFRFSEPHSYDSTDDFVLSLISITSNLFLRDGKIDKNYSRIWYVVLRGTKNKIFTDVAPLYTEVVRNGAVIYNYKMSNQG